MFFLELFASFLVLAQIYFYGKKSIYGPYLGLFSAIVLNIHMVLLGLWGFLPLNIIATGLHAYNAYKWK